MDCDGCAACWEPPVGGGLGQTDCDCCVCTVEGGAGQIDWDDCVWAAFVDGAGHAACEGCDCSPASGFDRLESPILISVRGCAGARASFAFGFGLRLGFSFASCLAGRASTGTIEVAAPAAGVAAPALAVGSGGG